MKSTKFTEKTFVFFVLNFVLFASKKHANKIKPELKVAMNYSFYAITQ